MINLDRLQRELTEDEGCELSLYVGLCCDLLQ